MTSRPAWREAADAVLFTIGAIGAAWEIFYQESNNIYVYALIVALLRIGQTIFDKIGRWGEKP